MRTAKTKVYKFNELSDDAKVVALDWGRYSDPFFNGWSEFIIDDFHERMMGIGINIEKGTIDWNTESPGSTDFEATVSTAKILKNKYPNWAIADPLKLLVDAEEGGVMETRYKDQYLDIDLNHDELAIAMKPHVELCLQRNTIGAEGFLRKMIEDMIEDFRLELGKRLKDEYEYMGTDEYVTEELLANEYEFTKEGNKWN